MNDHCPPKISASLQHGLRALPGVVLGIFVTVVSIPAGAQTVDWSVLVSPPAASVAIPSCPSSESVAQANAAAASIVRLTQGDIFVVSCPASTPTNTPNVASTAFAVARLSGATGAVLWRREFAGTEISFYDAIRNFIAVNTAGDVFVASSVLSDESGEFTYVVKYAGSSGQLIWQEKLFVSTILLDVLTTGNVRINPGNVAVTLEGNSGNVVNDFSQALPDRGGAPLVGGEVSFASLTSADGTRRRIDKYLVAGVLGAPTITITFAANDIISIAFLPPANDGGAPILDYRLTCLDGGGNGYQVTRTLSGSPATHYVDFAENPAYVEGGSVRCFVQARNLFGYGPASTIQTFFSRYSPLSLAGVVSRKVHGAFGTFDLAIARNVAAPGPVTVEPRNAGGGHLIVFQFNGLVNSVSNLSLTVGASPAVPLANFSFVDNELRIFLTAEAVPDGGRATISGSINGGSVGFSASLGFLLGDASNSRNVDAADISGIRSRSGQRASPENFRYDINASGVVSAADLLSIRARNGRVLDN